MPRPRHGTRNTVAGLFFPLPPMRPAERCSFVAALTGHGQEARRVAPARPGRPGEELLGTSVQSARISTLRRRRRGSWASVTFVARMWSAAVLDLALPARSMMASGSPDAVWPCSAKAVSGWPNVFCQVGAVWSFSNAVTMVSSISTGIRGQRPEPFPGSGPGKADRLQCPRRVRGRTATRRETTGSEATGSNSSSGNFGDDIAEISRHDAKQITTSRTAQ